MPAVKEIRSKIQSVKSTKKITRAMQMVAASKMRKAQERMRASRPYSERIKSVISHLTTGRLEYQHPYLVARKPKRVGFIIISTDRGLCGGLNWNLFKTAVQEMREWQDKGADIDIATIGEKAEQFFKCFGTKIIASLSTLDLKSDVQDVLGIVKVMIDAYDKGHLDRIYIFYNHFINTMVQKPKIDLLLPIMDTELKTESGYSWDYLYEPNAKELLEALIVRYIESLVYQSLVENGASEQAARMVAMKNASENANEIINDLQLMYNKVRQATITRELSEIVAGAAAV
jgi:F-type H+-transporting ATPase subunit gamma